MPVQSTNPAASSFQDVIAVVVDTARDEVVIRALGEICTASGGHASAILTPPLPEFYYAGDGMPGASVWSLVIAQLREDARREVETLQARLKKASCSVELRTAPLDYCMAPETVVMSARHADMTIMPQATADPKFNYMRELLERVLFESGRPVLVAPTSYDKPFRFKKVVIAWKPTREATRAVGDAADVFASAELVTVVTVDAKPSSTGSGEAPGQDIATHLARRGVKVDVRNVDGMGRRDADSILDVAHAIDADLIVLGAFGHSRLRETVFGGVTKHLLQSSDVPLLMSH
jgi:nucleotide-binding universal stress UspA family protein